MKKTFYNFCILTMVAFLLAATILALAPTITPAQPAEKKTWRFYSTPEGGFAYSVAMGLIRVANKHNTTVQLVVTTGKGAPASHQLYDKGEIDTSYGSSYSMYQAWNNEGMFATSPVKYRTYHGVCLFTADYFFLTKAGRTDINSLSDLAGKRVYPWYRGSGSYDMFKLVLTKLGLWDKIIDRQMGVGEMGDALKTGMIDAIGANSISQISLMSAVKELETRVDLHIVNPSAKEIELIAKIPAVFVPAPFPPTMFARPVGVDKIVAFCDAWSWNFGPNEDTDRAYGIAKSWFEHPDELAAINPGFEQFAKTGIQMNVALIDSLSDIPVHPGMAKFLKERGAWKNSWKIGKLYPRP